MSRLSVLPFQDLGFAKVDHHRAVRKGFPETIFGQGKTPEQIAAVSESVVASTGLLLVTRATPEAYAAVKARVPEAEYDETARTITVDEEGLWNLVVSTNYAYIRRLRKAAALREALDG
jgi:NCAIR mutase (PurE)-related protein